MQISKLQHNLRLTFPSLCLCTQVLHRAHEERQALTTRNSIQFMLLWAPKIVNAPCLNLHLSLTTKRPRFDMCAVKTFISA